MITINNEILTFHRQGKNWFSSQQGLESHEALFTLIRPYKGNILLDQVGQLGSNGRKFLNESTVVAAKPSKLLISKTLVGLT